jgi:hypothetical protein
MASLSSVLAYTALAFLAISPTAHGLGINCRGSGYCTWNDDKNTYEARTLTYFINGIDGGRWYNNGEHIACTPSGICAFLQKTGGTWGSKIKELAHYIPDHGCTICGSVPYYFPDGNNNVDDGMLTYNYVSNPKCKNGLC